MSEPDPVAPDIWAAPAGQGVDRPYARPATPAGPPVRPAGPPPAREAGAGLAVAAVVTALGVPVGAIWWALAPHVAYRVARGGQGVPADFETKGFVADDGWFFVVAALAGLICGFAGYLLARRYGLGVTVGLAAGGIAAAVVAWKFGSALGSGGFHHALRTRAVGTTVHAPPGLRAKGVLVAWPVGALVAYVVATAYGAEPHGARGEAVEPVATPPEPAGPSPEPTSR